MTHGLNLVLALLAASALAVSLLRGMRLPAILGYLLVGIVLGPHASGLVAEDVASATLGDFGVVFLMFSVGLEFSLSELFSMRRFVFGLGGLQMGTSLLGMALIGRAVGLQWPAALTVAGALALSSTAILSKLLSEKAALRTAHGQRIMGVALFQDIAVVPLLIVLPALATSGGDLTHLLLWAVIKAVILLTLMLSLGRRLLTGWLTWAANQKSSEIFVLNVLFLALFMAWASAQAGLSLALGAFVAGALISETDYRYQVADYIKPFKDVLLGLFFIGIGMLLNIGLILENLLLILAALLAVTLFKGGSIYLITRLTRNNDAIAMRVSLALAFCGEFGFVIMAQGGILHLLGEATLQVVLSVLLLSMLISPLVMQATDRIVLKFSQSEWAIRALALHETSRKSMSIQQHVLVCGFGRCGQAVTRFLSAEGISSIAMDLDVERVRAAAAAGESVVYGDAGRREVLIAAGIHRASALIVSFADVGESLKIIAHARELEPKLPVIVRTHDDVDLEKLRAAGAAEVVPEVLEGALMLASQAMLELGVPLIRVLKGIRTARNQRYGLTRGFYAGDTDASQIESEDAQRLQSVMLAESALALGLALEEIELPAIGVTVRALRRPGVGQIDLTETVVLKANDVLVIQGTPSALSRAERRLLG